MKKILAVAILFSLLISGIFAENVGLVLSGGGAKGAYEVGVWKAMADYGITDDVSVISGSSVGALNAALFACINAEEAEKLWREEVGYSAFLMPDTSSISEVAAFAVRNAQNNLGIKNSEDDPYGLKGKFSEEDTELMRYLLDGITFIADAGYGLARGTLNYIGEYIFTQNHSDGLFNRDALGELMEDYISIKKLEKSNIDVYATAIPKDGLLLFNAMFKLFGSDSAHYFKLNEQLNDEMVQDILMASSSFPLVYDSTYLSGEVIENGYKVGIGYEYIDGGFESVGGKNTPVYPVAMKDNVETIFVVYLKSEEEMNNSISNHWVYEGELRGKKLIEFVPSKNLGDFIDGTINFDPENISELIDLGYQDACAVLEENGYEKPKKGWFKKKTF